MSDRRTLIHRDADTGYEQHVHYDEADDVYRLRSTQDVEPTIELSRQLFNERSGERYLDGLTHIGFVPQVIIDKLMAEKRWITQDPAAFKKWWNDPDNRAFHSRPGRV